jgi:hypothetical protein
MATYHQLKAEAQGRGPRLYHDTEWTVVVDPPNQVRCLVTFSTEVAAQAYKAVAGPHAYVLRPASVAR